MSGESGSGGSGLGPGRPKSAGPRHVFKTGAAGCGGKAGPTSAKNSGQPLPCPFCDRIFKQDGRLKEHLKNQHEGASVEQAAAEELAANAGASGSGSAGDQTPSYSVKTPKTQLHEWCQKNKKLTPKYKHVEVDGGFHCRVILPDGKKSEDDVIVWYKEAPAPASLEAQHRAAVVALHHVMGDRRLDRILPEQYRQQWHNLDAAAEQRKAFLKANPPKPKQIRKPSPKELQSVFMSEGNRRIVEDLLRNVDSNSDPVKKNMESSANPGDVRSSATDNHVTTMQVTDHDTPWFSQTVEPSERESDWGCEQGNSVSGLQCKRGVAGMHGNRQLDVSLSSLHLQLEKMGFSDDYVRLAVDRTNNVSQALDWLVLNVPEHKLPAKFAPESSKASVQVLVRESQFVKEPLAAIGRAVMSLQQFGYSEDRCQAALVLASGDKDVALYHLFQSLIADECPQANRGPFSAACAELAAATAEEKLALLSIFGDDVVELSESCLTFQLASVEMEVRFPPGCVYPHEIPVVGFRNPSLSSDYLLDITKKVANHAQQFVGSPMIYDLVTYAQEVTDVSLLASESRPVGDQDASKMSISDLSHKSVEGFLDNYQPFEGKKSPLIDLNLDKLPVHEYPMSAHRDTSLAKASGAQTRSPHLKRQQELLSLESQRLKRQWENLQGSSKHAKMQGTRSKLPAFTKRSSLLSTIDSSRVTIICGETGCGKSTQVPQYILEEYIEKGEGGICNIICTQPRRLSAIGLADRVAQERREATGETVGYSVRLENCRSERTRLLFCTTGILLRRLLSDPGLDGVTHVIVDEVHERTLESDLLLLLLRELIGRGNSSPHVILMSATVEASLYSDYFAAVVGYSLKIVRIPGFTFPVRELYLEDAFELTGYRVGRNSRYALKKKKDQMPASSADLPQQTSEEMDSWESRFNDHETEAPAHLDHNLDHYSEGTRQSLSLVDENIINFELIEAIIVAIFQQDQKLETFGSLTAAKDDGADGTPIVGHGQAGAVLVFLPGMYEIKRLQSQLQRSSQLANCGYELWILALHGSLSGAEQRRVFLIPPAANVRKVVLATNIAETSITIDDVVYVVDTGHHKEMRYDYSRGLSCLEDTWISKANAKQRRGRAGRVQPGCCIRLFSRQQFQQFDEHQLPEVHRTSLEGLCLKVKSLLSGKIEDRVNKMISPPHAEAISTALKSLQELSALDSSETLTPLGQHLARMPVDARVAKMLLFGCILRCLDPVLTIAASLSGRSPFLSPMDKRDEASMARRKLADNSKSDHMAVVAAYNGWVTAKQEGWAAETNFCNSNYVSRESLISIEASRMDYERILVDLGFISSSKSRYPLEDESEGAQSNVHANSKHVRVVKACICAGFYPHVVRVHHPEKTYVQTEGGAVVKIAAAQELRFYTKVDGRVFLHPSSVLFPVGYFESPWLVFSEKVKTSKVFVRECSMVSAYGFLLFGGEIRVQHEKQTLAVDDWLQFEAPARIAVLIKELRLKVDSLLLQKIQIPSLEIGTSPVVTAIIRLLTTDGF